MGKSIGPPAAYFGQSISCSERQRSTSPMSSDYPPSFSAVGRTDFVFWKTDDQPEHIPNWEDRGHPGRGPAGLEADEARKLAQKRADELKAEAAAKPGKRLEELPSGKKKDFTVMRPPAFSFLARTMYRVNCALGDVIGLEKVDAPYAQDVPFHAEGVQPGPESGGRRHESAQDRDLRDPRLEFTPFDELWSNFTANADDWSVYALLRVQRR